MLKQISNCGLQVCLSIYDLLLTPGIKELRMKEITMQISDRNYKSKLSLILFSFQVPPFVCVDSPKLNKRNYERWSWLLVVRDTSWTLS